MTLYEFEGKRILEEAGIKVPKSQLARLSVEEITIPAPLVLKAQVLSGKRAKGGGIVVVEDESIVKPTLAELFAKVINGEKVEAVLVEEKVNLSSGREYYLSISYDTDSRSPIITFSEKGGTGVEEIVEKVQVYRISPLDNKLPSINVHYDVLKKLVDVFYKNDCLLLEINPFIEVNGEWIALDAKIKLDDSALNRHKEWDFSPRSVPGHMETEREVRAKKIDEEDYRGVAGSSYFDFEGDIAVLASGGGAALTAMDALIKEGGRPANYTEYSGNPSRGKVQKLTEIVLSKPNLNGLWVVGAIANFTDIYETMSGFVDGLRRAEEKLNTKFKFPILIRRGGPRDKEAFQMLKSVKDFNLHIYGEDITITESAKIMSKLAKQYVSSR